MKTRPAPSHTLQPAHSSRAKMARPLTSSAAAEPRPDAKSDQRSMLDRERLASGQQRQQLATHQAARIWGYNARAASQVVNTASVPVAAHHRADSKRGVAE